jgi:DNA repair exonuclease SbcCD nuclease subunit
LVTKVAEAYAIAQREGCEFVIFGGDFFQAHKIFSYHIINEVMDIICGAGVWTYAVLGQHDVRGYNPETYKTSTMAFMARHCGKFEVLWEPKEIGGLTFHPCHVWEDLEEAKRVAFQGGYHVLVAHQSLTNKKKMFDVVSTKDYGVGCPYQLVLSGHMHDGFEPHRVSDTWFCNPGGLARRAIDEIDRVPMVAIIEAEPGQKPEVEPVLSQIELFCAKPGSEVFAKGVAEVAREMDDFDATAFVEDIEKFEASSVDVFDLVSQIGLKEKVDPEVLAYIEGKR